MTSPPQPSAGPPPTGDDDRLARLSRLERRRERVVADIRRNREGNHLVPTWVMALLLFAILGAWLLLIITN